MKFPSFKQLDSVDCGPTCLQIVAKYFGKHFRLEFLREICFLSKEGVNLLSLSKAAETIGFNVLNVQLKAGKFINDAPLPAILLWDLNHFVVIYELVTNKVGDIKYVKISDPRSGLRKVKYNDFLFHWQTPENVDMGIALLLEPNVDFYSNKFDKELEVNNNSKNIAFLTSYIIKFKKYFFQLSLGIVATSLISFLFPILTQNIVDVGIKSKDLNFITLVLLAQMVLIFTSTIIEYIRRKLILHIGVRINVSIISDFLSKLFKLPIRFFESKNVGDIITRINDQKRIEQFITNSTLSTFLHFFNFFALLIVLSLYNLNVFIIFIIGSLFSFLWILFFQRQRRDMDFKLFRISSTTNEKTYEMVNGMQEIKLNNFENYKKEEWKKNQINLFKLNLENLSLEQFQQLGTIFFTQLKNIVITFMSAKAVIEGDISLGILVSISMIVGQLNSPLDEFISFFKTFQLANISIDRMFEVYNKNEEDNSDEVDMSINKNEIRKLFEKQTSDLTEIKINNVSFQYGGPESEFVLKNISFNIPIGKTTAIVGTSGSGKSTMIKLLLKYFNPTHGNIIIGEFNLRDIPSESWRLACASVMQDGFIFSETIERNISMDKDPEKSKEKIIEASKIANIFDFVNQQPFKFLTKIGPNGVGISMGQKQRILIARAVFRNPFFFLLDEATSSLDANNEKDIVNNLNKYFKGKTAVIVAHRLSTVKNADHIIVLEAGEICEMGNHETLLKNKGAYYNLVKNQLELSV